MIRLIIITVVSVTLMCSPAFAAEEIYHFGRFGNVTLYRTSPHPSNVVLFVSGDGGWNKGVIDMAKTLSGSDIMVIGIDVVHYMKELGNSDETCSYIAADFEMLSKFIQKKLDFPDYIHPILAGYSSGATLVYAAAVQAPPDTFIGAISLGFCPDLPLEKPLCRGSGLDWEKGPKGKGFSFLPASNLQTPWIALQGTIDQVCNPAQTEAFVRQVKNGQIVMLAKVGHGFSVQRNWLPQFEEAFYKTIQTHRAGLAPVTDELKDLPIVEVNSDSKGSDTLAVIISGDGGWAGLDREIGYAIAAHKIPVAGLNSLQYYWAKRTPEGSAKDLERILRHYLTYWNKEKVILIGYSFGAEVLPFMVNRLPEDILQKIQYVALLGPGRTAEFEFHISGWLGLPSTTALPLLPEMEKLTTARILCLYGEEEKDSLCTVLNPGMAKIIPLKGGHHFGGNYKTITEIILREAN
ncbi:MAG: virulence factor family protein [Nitrospirae bacterium]|nr:virulence factor family protein [Nitrospirota bacterium]